MQTPIHPQARPDLFPQAQDPRMNPFGTPAPDPRMNPWGGGGSDPWQSPPIINTVDNGGDSPFTQYPLPPQPRPVVGPDVNNPYGLQPMNPPMTTLPAPPQLTPVNTPPIINTMEPAMNVPNAQGSNIGRGYGTGLARPYGSNARPVLY